MINIAFCALVYTASFFEFEEPEQVAVITGNTLKKEQDGVFSALLSQTLYYVQIRESWLGASSWQAWNKRTHIPSALVGAKDVIV